MKALSDIELLTLIRADDYKAFETLYNRYWQGVFRAACQRIQDEACAEELVQETFLNLYVKRHSIQIKTSLKPYLYRVLKNKVVDEIRKRLHQQSYEASFDRTPIQSGSVHDLLEVKELKQQMASFADSLPDKCRAVFKLKQAELPNKVIAEKLAISEKTVEGHISHARRLMKHYFAQYFMWVLVMYAPFLK